MKVKFFLLFFISFCGLFAQQTISFKNNILDLSGEWGFQIDRMDEGVNNKWFNNRLNDVINLPGSMPEKLKGDDVTVHDFFLTPDKQYVGVAWYQKNIEIPSSWKGQRIILLLEHPHIETTVWVNGQYVGMQNSLCVRHKYDITEYLNTNKLLVSIRVDNRIKEINVIPDSQSITDQTQGNWNGIVGKIELQKAANTYIDDIQVFPDIEKKTAKVRVVIKSNSAKEADGTITLSATGFNSEKSHFVKSSLQKFHLKDSICIAETDLLLGDEMQLWDEFEPSLYKLYVEIEIESENERDEKEVQFGMREFKIKDKYFYVNGIKTMLRGTVECCDFPLTGYAPMDVESWIKVFRKCKNYGLNHLRFHSYCPPEAAFQAADIVGFYLQPEGPGWLDHGAKLGNGEPIDTFLMAETQEFTKLYSNYASFCMLACGNEQSDRQAPCVTKADVRGLDWASRQPETFTDFREKIDSVKQPCVSHEMGQWCVFPNFDEIRKYTGVNKAGNFEIFRDILEKNKMGHLAHQFVMASGKLQALCYKHEIEKALRTPDYAGFQLLALNDHSSQGTALVGVTDVFFDAKEYIDNEQFKRFCSPTVPLARIPKFTYTDNEIFKASIEVSHFGKRELNNAVITYKITDTEGYILKKGIITNESGINIPVGNNLEVGDIIFDFKNVKTPAKLNLEVSIQHNGEIQGMNDWDFWLYSKDVETDEGKVYITDIFDEKAKKVLQEGGNVLITAAGKIRYGKEIVQYFTPVFRDTSRLKMQPPHTLGILINDFHPVFKAFPTEYHSNLQWWELLNKQQVMQFTEFPADFQPIVQTIDTWFLSRKAGMLFEANVLKGKLMMTSMDITSEPEKRIVARQMYKSILDYINSEKFRPVYNIEPQLISNLFEKEDSLEN